MPPTPPAPAPPPLPTLDTCAAPPPCPLSSSMLLRACRASVWCWQVGLGWGQGSLGLVGLGGGVCGIRQGSRGRGVLPFRAPASDSESSSPPNAGHSLGGAVATLCALRLLDALPTEAHAAVSAVAFAAPPVGNAALAEAAAAAGEGPQRAQRGAPTPTSQRALV